MKSILKSGFSGEVGPGMIGYQIPNGLILNPSILPYDVSKYDLSYNWHGVNNQQYFVNGLSQSQGSQHGNFNNINPFPDTVNNSLGLRNNQIGIWQYQSFNTRWYFGFPGIMLTYPFVDSIFIELGFNLWLSGGGIDPNNVVNNQGRIYGCGFIAADTVGNSYPFLTCKLTGYDGTFNQLALNYDYINNPTTAFSSQTFDSKRGGGYWADGLSGNTRIGGPLRDRGVIRCSFNGSTGIGRFSIFVDGIEHYFQPPVNYNNYNGINIIPFFSSEMGINTNPIPYITSLKLG